MNINELFEQLEEYFAFNELNGELTLIGSEIVWDYSLEPSVDDNDDDMENEEEDIEIKSNEEILLDVYDDDIERINLFLDEANEIDYWDISDPEIFDDCISFTIA